MQPGVETTKTRTHEGTPIMCMVCLLLTVSIGEAGMMAQQSTDLIREGLQAYGAGDLTGAISKLRQAQQADPDNPQVRLYLGLVLYEQKSDSPEAQQLLESVADKFADNREVQMKLLDSYLSMGKTGQAEELLRRRQGLLEEEDAFSLRISYLLLRYGLSDLAQAQIHRVLARHAPMAGAGVAAEPRDPKRTQLLGEGFFLQGLIAAGEGRKGEALESLQAADRYGFPPLESPQMLVLADALNSLGELRLASQAYLRYLDHHPDDTEARMKWGTCLFSAGKLEEAATQFEMVAKQTPEYPLVNYHLGATLIELKRLDQGEARLRQELKRDPVCYRSLTKLAHLEYLRGNNDQCRALLDQARKIDSSWTEIYLIYGLLCNRLGQYDLAIENLRIVNRHLPELPAAHLQLSIAYQRTGDTHTAALHRDAYHRLIQKQKEDVIRGVDLSKPR